MVDIVLIIPEIEAILQWIEKEFHSVSIGLSRTRGGRQSSSEWSQESRRSRTERSQEPTAQIATEGRWCKFQCVL